MANYNPSTIARLGDIALGIRTDTSVLSGSTYLISGPTQTEIFTVKGRVFIKYLFIEAITDFTANATVVKFTTTYTVPVIAVNDMCAVCGSISGLVRGTRIMWPGGAVATAATLTDSAGLTDISPTVGAFVGGVGFTGSIGINTATASQGAANTFQVSCFWFQAADDSYVEAKL
jgi:hypothetical protein